MASPASSDTARSASTSTGAPTTWALGVFGAALTVYLLTTNYSGPTSSDVYAGSVQAWVLGTTGAPWVELAGEPERIRFALTELQGFSWVNGHIVYANAIGSWLFAAPLYAVLGDPGQFTLTGGAVAASLISALGVLWMYLALYRLVPPALALAGAAVFAFALPTWSVSAHGIWGHTITQCAIAGAALASATSRWWLAGLALGFGAFARAHLLVVAAVLGLGTSASRRSVGPAVKVGVASSFALAVLVALNTFVYGSPSIGGGRTGPLARLELGADVRAGGYLENVAGFLVSPGRGVLVFTPVLLVLLPTVVRVWRSAPDWTRWLAIGGVAYSALQLWIAHFFGGAAYSAYRLGLELATSLVPLYTFAFFRAGLRVRAIASFVIVCQLAAVAVAVTVRPWRWIVRGNEWTDNELVLLWRTEPLGSSLVLGAVLLLGLVVARRVMRSDGLSADAVAGDAKDSPPVQTPEAEHPR